MSAKIKVLFLAASPKDTNQLDLERESQIVSESIQSGEACDNFELVTNLAVRPDDLQQALLATRPHVLHFTGHGSTEAICLLDKRGNTAKVSKDALKHLLSVLKDNLQIVVLSACHSSLKHRRSLNASIVLLA